MENNLLELISVTQSFTRSDNSKVTILDNINFTLKSGEIVAIVGKSGSGKSTLLRIIAGLAKPVSGQVKIYNKDIPDEDKFTISMIFQTFALFPWLTVLENVEFGLKMLNISDQERRKRALDSIDLIGLDGFESAYPKELSGGMKQRVGFARALVLRPEILLMDEAFSALDILTADNLKKDFLNLWLSKKTEMKSVILVTHSIEEAVTIADRILIFASNPGRIIAELPIIVARPRDSQSVEFHDMVNKVYNLMVIASDNYNVNNNNTEQEVTISNIDHRLQLVQVNELIGSIEVLATPPYKGIANLTELVRIFHIHNIGEILKIIGILDMLNFINISNGEIKLTEEGGVFASSNLEERKKIFAKHLLANISLASYIREILDKRLNHRAPLSFFRKHLMKNKLSYEDANITLKSIIAWGRYAEIFSYDDSQKIFSLDNPIA